MIQRLQKIFFTMTILLMTVCLYGCGETFATYDDYHMTFSYDEDMNVTTFNPTEEVKNVTVSNKANTVVAASVIYRTKDMKSDELFQQIKDTYGYTGDIKEDAFETGKANDGNGTKAYKEFTVTTEDNTIRIFAQIQSFADSCYIATVAHIYEVTEENEKTASRICGSVTFSENVENAPLVDTPEECRAPLLDISTYLILEQGITPSSADESDEYQKTVDGLDADMTYHAVEGYTYLKSREISTYEGTVYTILVPETEDNYANAMSYFYSGHGLDINIFATSLYGGTPEKYIKQQDYTFASYKENKKDYSNAEEGELVKEDKLAYQICTADHLNYDNSVSKEGILIGLILKEDEDAVSINIAFREADMDQETALLLTELEKAYKLPVSDFAIDEEKLTYSGEVMDASQETYKYTGKGTEVVAEPGYELLGSTTLTAYDSTTAGLLIPMGSRTSVNGSYASSDMHGVKCQINFTMAYSKDTIVEQMESELKNDYSYILENARDYTNVSDINISNSSSNSAGIGSFTYDKILDDGSTYSMENILIKVYVGTTDEYLATIKITLDQADFDSRTELLLQEISTAYGISYSDLVHLDLKNSIM